MSRTSARNRGLLVPAFLLYTAAALPLSAQAPPEPAPTATPAPGSSFTLGGYAELFASHGFNDPSNGITQNRGFDAREDRLAIDNVAVDARGSAGPLSGRLTLQWGLTPDTYYAAEPGDRGWRHIQQAYVGYSAPVGSGLLFEGGIFLSPIGPEGIAVKDNWSWSRSDLFFGLPFYHAGLKATYAFSSAATLMVMVTNGWNNVKDGNDGKSVIAQLQVTGPNNLAAAALYMGGPERPTGAPEGQPWRHLFDAWARFAATERLALQTQVNGGFEDNRLGTSSWLAAGLSMRYRARPFLNLSARGDVFWESVPDGASPIFWSGAGRVASATFTVDVRPFPDHLAVMLETRRDWATADIYFKGAVPPGGATNARAQTTVTLGVTGWY